MHRIFCRNYKYLSNSNISLSWNKEPCITPGAYVCQPDLTYSCVVGNSTVSSALACQSDCEYNYACWSFTFDLSTGICLHMDSATEEDNDVIGVVKGPWTC